MAANDATSPRAGSSMLAELIPPGLMIGKTGPVFGSRGNAVKFKLAVNVDEDEIVEIFAKSPGEVEAVL